MCLERWLSNPGFLQVLMSIWAVEELQWPQIRYAALNATIQGAIFRSLRQLHASSSPSNWYPNACPSPPWLKTTEEITAIQVLVFPMRWLQANLFKKKRKEISYVLNYLTRMASHKGSIAFVSDWNFVPGLCNPKRLAWWPISKLTLKSCKFCLWATWRQ